MSDTSNVLYIYLPPGEGAIKQGVDDFFAAGHNIEDVLGHAGSEAKSIPTSSGAPEADSGSQSGVLVSCIEPENLFHTPQGEEYVRLPVDAHMETHSLGSGAVRRYLQKEYFFATGRPPSDQSLKEAIETLKAQALFNGPENEVHIRVARMNGKTYIDLANDEWEAVELDESGWRIVSDPPVFFRRPNTMKSLPRPSKVGDLGKLKLLINIEDEDSWHLLVCWLLQSLVPTGPYPILILQGEQGSAKTTTAKIIKGLIDPSVTAVRALPTNDRDLVIAATNTWTLVFDNLSYLNGKTSDALCRMSTGGGFATRTLYEDSEETVFDVMRPTMLNGITDLTSRADLLDRAVVVHLPTISPEKRKLESELWDEFASSSPNIFGGILDVICAVQGTLPDVTLGSPPRMADFARYGVAVEKALGWNSGAFMKAYAANIDSLREVTLDSDPVATALIAFMEDKQKWSGTMTDLLVQLSFQVDDTVKRSKRWPKDSSSLGKCLKRAAPGLRAKNIEVEDAREAGTGSRIKHIHKIQATPDTVTNDCDTSDGSDTTTLERRCHYVSSKTGLKELVDNLNDKTTLAIDLETTGLDFNEDTVEVVSISTEDQTWIIDCAEVDPQQIFPALSNKELVFHNASFDLAFLMKLGFLMDDGGKVVDTMLMSQVIEGTGY